MVNQPETYPAKLFISYSHKDKKFLKKLVTSLAMLVRERKLEIWYDWRILAGDKVDASIMPKLNTADIILFLVSPDFLDSDFCYKEMTRAMERHEVKEARVIPVILRPCDWKSAPFGKLLAVPKDGKAVKKWKDRDDAWQDVTKEIRRVLEETEEPTSRIDAALEALQKGDATVAEAIFQDVLDTKEKEGRRNYKEAAQAARHIGAMAFMHDTKKALEAYEKAVALDPDNPDGWNQLGHLRLRVGKITEAEKAYEHVLALGNRAKDKVIIAVAHGNLGNIYRVRGELECAEAAYKEALAINEELGRKEVVAAVYGNLGVIYLERGELDRAEAAHKKALAINEELGRKEGMAKQYGNLGLIYRARGELDRAEAAHNKALAISEELGHKESIANAHSNLGLIYELREELDHAEKVHKKSLDINKELGRKEGMANNYSNLGNIYARREDLDGAEAGTKEALAIFEELGGKEGIAEVHDNLGVIYLKRGELKVACENWRKALLLFKEIGIPYRVKEVQELMREAGCPQVEDESL